MATSISDREFHDRAKSLKPDQVIKPTRYWVGILYHDKKVSEVSQEADFLWIKAHGVCSSQPLFYSTKAGEGFFYHPSTPFSLSLVCYQLKKVSSRMAVTTLGQ